MTITYDMKNGNFYWLRHPSRKSKSGQLAGSNNSEGYRVIRINKKDYYGHRLAWFYVTEKWPENDIDHIDGNKSNNAFRNLREATRSQNNANQKLSKRNKSGYKGVCWDNKEERWIAQTRSNGKMVFIGYFDDPLLAHEAWKAKMTELHGTFVRAA